MAAPKLNPPCKGWQQDLPGPNEPLTEAPMLLWFAPTHLDATYMELPRNALNVRGVMIGAAGLMGITTVAYIALNLWGFAISTYTARDLFVAVILGICVTAIGGWITCFTYRADVAPPRDLPVRFNRLRRKAYVYGFHSVWWNPFTRWYVTTASYDWDDLRAEKWKVRAATANGGLIIKEGVSIAVVRPGTNDVIERFDLSTRAANTSNAWAYVCHYMQHGKQGLDPSEAEPYDANDVPPYNIALRLAPKVEWPAEMDAESRSAP
ncbi:DUF6708 domain-containing protein [Paraburkholderia tropica]|uniref:DUF6708 domain-containing protein n=1 Tax=Paraburkholderia tropica TaxID=92647 RepID=A0ABX5MW32_9BURK|nr:DUF6708 domain-containing protein [Paraburkholderia tropica]MBB2998966.1 hypothetical protein [Paraburkholderia tropica]MBB6318259.1 hypothetical protein [Paraburkholderia tropica]MDE1139186.1 hypothetical protein [Paraburkholderia tropica]PXX19632.1 hypothetical protein C7400_10256 [Paraburkholderia tropica]PZW88573.1 hypothetical protein C7399_10256 [Paraburkholderia tropica]